MMNEGNNTPPCGEEAGALRDVRQAEADLKKAEAKMLEAIADEQRAVQRLEAAEAELEHARHHEIEIFVDGEEYKPQRHEMTPNEIIRDFGGKTDVSKFYLMEIAKPENLSFQGKGDTPICLRNKMAFMVMSLAPATVSDPGTPLVGVPAFTAGLEAMGYSPRQLANNPSAIAFYAGIDAHLGSRLHAHLLCLSRGIRSWLVPVDGRALGIAEPHLSVEPGRAIVGPAMCTVYTVGTVKSVELDGGARRSYVSVDGGMSDNIRTALYGADYSCTIASRRSSAPGMLSRVVGKHCEAGDILVKDEFLPADLVPGDLVAVPGTGAYCRSMASNYNHALRPPVIAVRDGVARVIVRRETVDDLLATDIGVE